MNKQEALTRFAEKSDVIKAYSHAISIMHWDGAIEPAPPASLGERSKAQGFLAGKRFQEMMCPESYELLAVLEDEYDTLTPGEKRMTDDIGRTLKRHKAVPPEEYQKYMELIAQARPAWEKARRDNDFALIQPYYEKIFEFSRRSSEWFGYEKHPYDAHLDDYEHGATVEMLDAFFAPLREGIVPLLKKITESGRQTPELTGIFPIEKQRKLGVWAAELVGFDFSRGRFGEVEHPFTLTVNHDDVRISTTYFEDRPFSALYSTIHEAGHGIYEQNIDPALGEYMLDDAASMGVHESQSRLYENMIGLSKPFAGLLLPKLQEFFPEFRDWNEDRLYRTLNIAKPSLIRVDADELSYCLHVMVRYELEKALLAGDLQVRDLPGAWDDLYEEYLGIRPADYKTGLLQDTHWGGGMVGYFPSYAVGTAYSAQIVHGMKKTVDFDGCIARADFAPINSWLKENIHRHGLMKTPEQLILDATGESFSAQYYVDYLTEKFSELYL